MRTQRSRFVAVTIGFLMLAGLSLLSAPPVRAAQFQIKLGHGDPADVYTSRKAASSTVFKQMVESETGGAVEVQVFPAGQAGGRERPGGGDEAGQHPNLHALRALQ